MKVERLSTSIEQWYEQAINLDRYQRESQKEEEKKGVSDSDSRLKQLTTKKD